MQEILKPIVISITLGLLLFVYVKMFVEHFREKKLYKEKRNIYIRDKDFLLMGNDGNLLTLTAKNKGFDVQKHYFADSSMIITESGDC